MSICKGFKIGAYLSDIAGAFDRVFKPYLLAKFQAAGIGATYLNFLDAYLQPRRAQVMVEGEASDEFEISNTVFQGTVLGPVLWNVFFAGIAQIAAAINAEGRAFADDYNAFKRYAHAILSTASSLQT